jgi:hypothetical protein
MTILGRRNVLLGVLLLSGFAAVGVAPSAADPGDHGGAPWGEGRRRPRRHRGDHDCALRALAEGRAKPLSEILPPIEKELGGNAIDVELEHCSGRIVYEIKLLRPDGRLIEAVVDAQTGKRIEDGD